MVNFVMKKLKPLKWYDDRPGFDGIIRHSTGFDNVSVDTTKIHIRYDVTANISIKNGTDDGTFSVLVQFPYYQCVKEVVYSFEYGKKRCEELREEFWNKFYHVIGDLFIDGE